MKEVLLVIDMQNVYKEGQPWGCPNIGSVTENIIRLLASNRFDSIFLTRHLPASSPIGTWKQYNQHYDQINSTAHLSQLVSELMPYAKKHIVLEKTTYSACPVLPARVFEVPQPRIIITGVVAQCCVLSTVMGLIDQGNEIIYLSDAVAGQHSDFEEMTQSIISTFSPLHTQVMSTKEYLSNIHP